MKTYCVYKLDDSIIKMSVLFKLIYRFNAFSIKIPANIHVDINKLILKFVRRHRP